MVEGICIMYTKFGDDRTMFRHRKIQRTEMGRIHRQILFVLGLWEANKLRTIGKTDGMHHDIIRPEILRTYNKRYKKHQVAGGLLVP